jgi:hypothetical protein
VVLENDGEDQLDPSCEELKSIALSQEGKEYPAYNEKKEGRLTGLVTTCVGAAVENMLLKER